MKKIFTFTFLLSFSLVSFAQEQPRFVYCEMVTSGPSLLSNDVTIEIDFGEESRLMVDKRMRDPETGELLRFNSKIDAVNFLGRHGWELMQVFTVPSGETFSEYHYVFKRKVEGNENEESGDY